MYFVFRLVVVALFVWYSIKYNLNYFNALPVKNIPVYVTVSASVAILGPLYLSVWFHGGGGGGFVFNFFFLWGGGGLLVSIVLLFFSFYFYRWNLMDILSSLSSRDQPNWSQATVSAVLQNLIQTLATTRK